MPFFSRLDFSGIPQPTDCVSIIQYLEKRDTATIRKTKIQGNQLEHSTVITTTLNHGEIQGIQKINIDT